MPGGLLQSLKSRDRFEISTKRLLFVAGILCCEREAAELTSPVRPAKRRRSAPPSPMATCLRRALSTRNLRMLLAAPRHTNGISHLSYLIADERRRGSPIFQGGSRGLECLGLDSAVGSRRGFAKGRKSSKFKALFFCFGGDSTLVAISWWSVSSVCRLFKLLATV